MPPDSSSSRLLAVVALVCQVDPAVLTSRERDRKSCRARAVAAVLLREQGRTLQEIGRVFGRHHSTVCHLLDGAPGPEDREVAQARAMLAGPDVGAAG